MFSPATFSDILPVHSCLPVTSGQAIVISGLSWPLQYACMAWRSDSIFCTSAGQKELMPSIPATQNNFPHHGHIKDEPVHMYKQEPVQEMRLAAIQPEHGARWANSLQPAGLRQTL